jgi:hypothetical protein
MNLRTDDNLVMVEEFTRNIARKFLQLLQKFGDKEVVMKIVGPKGFFWDTMTKEDIQGEYETLIDPGSTTKESDAIRRKQATDLMGILIKVPGINTRRVVTDVIKSFDGQRIDEYFGPNFDQMNGLTGPAPSGSPTGPAGQIAQEGVPNERRIATDVSQLGPLTK